VVPAPAQGTVMITALEKDAYAKDACEQLNHRPTEVCVNIERDFLNRLEGGCTAPIGALAYIHEKTEEINFKGIVLNREGTKKITVAKTAPVNRHRYLAKDCADYLINKGAKELMEVKEVENKEFSVYSTKKLSEIQKSLFPPSMDVLDSDFIKIRFNRITPKTIKNEIENVIITSKNGVESILNSFTKDELQFKNIYCVGRRTKRLIESRIGRVVHAAKNAEKLAEFLSKEIKGQEVTYFCSDLRLDILPTILLKSGIRVNEVEAYKTMYSPVNVADDVNGVLFYSPSTIESYLQKNKPNKVAFCIGESTAKEARKHFEKVEVANLPTVESVVELVSLHFVKE